MPRFFVEHVTGNEITITGADAAHIGRVLRMGAGESLVVCDTSSDTEYFCKIVSVEPEAVRLAVDEARHCAAEPSVKVHLYQALPKADKMELIIQKAVELGVTDITPIQTRRCVSCPDAKSMGKKLERWRRIAYEAAKQSGRGKIPQVHELLDYRQAVASATQYPLSLICYELGGKSLRVLLEDCPDRVALIIGAEGGFDEGEVAHAADCGVETATLGKRILRCETAPLCALSAIMLQTGNLE